MDEQRNTQQARKNGPHRSNNRNRLRAAGFIPAVGINPIQTFDKTNRPSTFKTSPSRHNHHLCLSIYFRPSAQYGQLRFAQGANYPL
jgi:hypothetical protein